jgi:hypothetical protein
VLTLVRCPAEEEGGHLTELLVELLDLEVELAAVGGVEVCLVERGYRSQPRPRNVGKRVQVDVVQREAAQPEGHRSCQDSVGLGHGDDAVRRILYDRLGSTLQVVFFIIFTLTVGSAHRPFFLASIGILPHRYIALSPGIPGHTPPVSQW